MSFEKQYCIIAVCDVCGPACWDTELAPHYNSEREARDQLARLYEWRITRQIDGRFRMLCARCADREDCERLDCDFQPALVDTDSEQQKAWEAEHPQPLEMCHRCGVVRRDHAPAVGHLEAVTAISDDEKAIFARLDAELFPEEAL